MSSLWICRSFHRRGLIPVAGVPGASSPSPMLLSIGMGSKVMMSIQRRSNLQRRLASFHASWYTTPAAAMMVSSQIRRPWTQCETTTITSTTSSSSPSLSVPPLDSWKQATLGQKIRRIWRLLKRMIKLTFTLAPVVAFYPILLLLHQRDPQEDAHIIALRQNDDEMVTGFLGWYLRLCLACVESSGAAVIKLMQWAGSRPDLFGSSFCAVFSKLQDHTTPHHWKHTEAALREAYGDNWQEKIQLHEIIGSGCIGQVYSGTVQSTTTTTPSSKQGKRSTDAPTIKEQKVAVKVLHPNVHVDIDADLDLMRLAVRAIKYVPFDVFSNLKWLNMEGIVEEFAGLLKLQIDLRREAANLERFNHNFKSDRSIEFPKIIPGYAPTDKVLVESFCEGIPVLQFCRENQDNQELLSKLCAKAISAVCKMIFLDNFVHGDLHPGNVYVSPDGKKFILFDVGIVNEYHDDDHNVIIDVLAAFIRKKGRDAARCMIHDSNSKLLAANTGDAAVEVEKYMDKIEMLTIKASTKGYFMEHLGTYITYICDTAAKHHVMMNPAFISAALAVKVQEGIALAMDPSCEIPTIAIPIIIESERKRMANTAVATLDRFKDLFLWTSNKES